MLSVNLKMLDISYIWRISLKQIALLSSDISLVLLESMFRIGLKTFLKVCWVLMKLSSSKFKCYVMQHHSSPIHHDLLTKMYSAMYVTHTAQF